MAAPSASWAICFAPGDPDCLPDNPLSEPFVAAERQVGCHDIIVLDEEGRDVKPPPPSPLKAFAQRMGDPAIPFYEWVIQRCAMRGAGWRMVAFSALAGLGTPKAISALEEHARPGQPDRDAALSALLPVPAFASSANVGERLRGEPDPAVRRILTIWLLTHGDATALPALREARAGETQSDPERLLEVTLRQVEHPDRCALLDNEWQWRTLGNECHYICRGSDYPVRNAAWRGILPCAATVSRGHHLLAPRATVLWLVPVLLVVGLDLFLRRGLVQGIVRRRARAWGRPARAREAVYIGIAWCAVSLIPLGAALLIWWSIRR
jgi:hypothetical protein